MGSKRLPTTKADVQMGMRHLQKTIDLERSKIADHRKAASAAKRAGDKGSVAYNTAHMEGHQKDIKERQKAYKKYSKQKIKALKKKAKNGK